MSVNMIGQQIPLPGNWWGEGLGRTFKRGLIHGGERGTAGGISRSKSGEVVVCDCKEISTGRGGFRSYTWRNEYVRWD